MLLMSLPFFISVEIQKLCAGELNRSTHKKFRFGNQHLFNAEAKPK